MNTKRASLSSFVYFYFLVPGDRIPHIPPFLLQSPWGHKNWNIAMHRRSDQQNAEVGHVRKHSRFLETTTSKDHSPHDEEIKARWGSGLSFKYSWGYKGGRRWEVEFWNRTRRRPTFPRPKGDSKQVWTQSKPRDRQGNYLLKSSWSRNFHHFVITF